MVFRVKEEVGDFMNHSMELTRMVTSTGWRTIRIEGPLDESFSTVLVMELSAESILWGKVPLLV